MSHTPAEVALLVPPAGRPRACHCHLAACPPSHSLSASPIPYAQCPLWLTACLPACLVVLRPTAAACSALPRLPPARCSSCCQRCCQLTVPTLPPPFLPVGCSWHSAGLPKAVCAPVCRRPSPQLLAAWVRGTRTGHAGSAASHPFEQRLPGLHSPNPPLLQPGATSCTHSRCTSCRRSTAEAQPPHPAPQGPPC